METGYVDMREDRAREERESKGKPGTKTKLIHMEKGRREKEGGKRKGKSEIKGQGLERQTDR